MTRPCGDGPLTTAVRAGATCYLYEVIEARADTLTLLHPLADERRILTIEKTGELLRAAPGFLLVVSYNPGYQRGMKELKNSFVGGVTAGAIGGALTPLATSNLRAALLGAIAIVPMGLTWRLMTSGLAPWTGRDTFVQVVSSVTIGSGWAIITRAALVKTNRRSRSRTA